MKKKTKRREEVSMPYSYLELGDKLFGSATLSTITKLTVEENGTTFELEDGTRQSVPSGARFRIECWRPKGWDDNEIRSILVEKTERRRELYSLIRQLQAQLEEALQEDSALEQATAAAAQKELLVSRLDSVRYDREVKLLFPS